MLSATFKAGPPVVVKHDPAHPLARALAGCWLFNEGAGRAVHDVGGHRCHGSFSGEPVWAPGEFGGAVEFDGNDDWLDMGDRLNQGTDDITVCAVVRYSAANQPDNWFGICLGAIVGKGYHDDGGKGYGLYVNGDNEICWEVRDQTSKYVVASDNALNDGQFHMAVGVCDRDSATGLRLYIDGIRQSSTNDPTGIEGHDLTGARAFGVGSRQEEDSGTWHWDFLGAVACVYVWRRVLSDVEIRALQCDPFVLFARRRFPALLGAPGGQSVSLAGATAGQSAVSGTLRVVRRMSGSVSATASLSAVVRSVCRLAGNSAAHADLTGVLTARRIVSLSGTTQAVSQLMGHLRVAFVRPVYAAAEQDKPFWLREALFQGATATGARLGTVLTQGWFWVRRAGCAAVYHGTSMADVDFDNILCVVDPGVTAIPLPGYLPHDPSSRHYYVVRRFDGCGYTEQTKTAAVVLRIEPNGQLIHPAPNGVFHLDCVRAADSGLHLSWFYCPLDHDIAPDTFNIYRGGDAGQIDMGPPWVVVPYRGRRFYRYRSGSIAAGTYRFVVKATSVDDGQGALPVAVRCQIESEPPPAPEILAAEPV